MKTAAALFLSAGALFLPVLRGEETPFDWKCKMDGETILVTAEVAKDSYIYKESTVISITPSDGIRLLTEPSSVKHRDDSGETQVYQGPGTFLWKYSTGKSRGPWKAEVSFQGCKSAGNGSGGMCLMPEKRSFSLVSGTGTGENSDGKTSTEKKNDVLGFPSYTIV
ncbi:MAG: protein-disulfide reductase DsbD N-terminal domain-containing protein, partial [Lentisphaeria bacterium]|nr:protein-disulfide reductase DsbD N-terminal domain-containing protein [Lentisphaeria bacterium]